MRGTLGRLNIPPVCAVRRLWASGLSEMAWHARATPALEKTNMGKLILSLLAAVACSFVSNVSEAQVGSVSLILPATKLESFDTNNSSLIIKGTTEAGFLTINTTVV